MAYKGRQCLSIRGSLIDSLYIGNVSMSIPRSSLAGLLRSTSTQLASSSSVDCPGGNGVERVKGASRALLFQQLLAIRVSLMHGVCPCYCWHGCPGEKRLLVARHFLFLFFLADGFHGRVRRVAAAHWPLSDEVICHQLTLTLHSHQTPLLKDVPEVL